MGSFILHSCTRIYWAQTRCQSPKVRLRESEVKKKKKDKWETPGRQEAAADSGPEVAKFLGPRGVQT